MNVAQWFAKFFTAFLLCFSTIVIAQQNDSQSAIQKKAQPEIQMSASDLLSRVRATNEFEIKVGRLAAEKGHSNKVRSYGDRLVKDHSTADQKITKLAKEKNIQIHEPVPKSEQEKMTMQQHKEVLSKLQTLSGPEFDRTFLSAMQMGHQQTIKILKSAEFKDSDVKDLIGKLIPILEQHLEMAAHLDPKFASK